jgi:hypothetical protein
MPSPSLNPASIALLLNGVSELIDGMNVMTLSEGVLSPPSCEHDAENAATNSK